MSEHQISLPDGIYKGLLAAARASGVTPADWIASQLHPDSTDQPVTFASISDLIGTIDSQQHPHHPYQKTSFGEAIAAKLAKQGIQRP